MPDVKTDMILTIVNNWIEHGQTIPLMSRDRFMGSGDVRKKGFGHCFLAYLEQIYL